jgi:Outer membrane protein beta-barrel domain
MKRLSIIFLLSTFITTVTFAQIARFGVNAGVAFASGIKKNNNTTVTSKTKTGLTVGFLGDIVLTEKFSFQPGINFIQKGGKESSTTFGITLESSTTLNYLELPLNFVYNAPAGSGYFFAGLGPVLGYGMNGKAKIKVSTGGETTQDVKFGSGAGETKPFEFSGNVLAGYELSNGIFITANYNIGISNLINNPPSNSSSKNRYFGIKLGYKFGLRE